MCDSQTIRDKDNSYANYDVSICRYHTVKDRTHERQRYILLGSQKTAFQSTKILDMPKGGLQADAEKGTTGCWICDRSVTDRMEYREKAMEVKGLISLSQTLQEWTCLSVWCCTPHKRRTRTSRPSLQTQEWQPSPQRRSGKRRRCTSPLTNRPMPSMYSRQKGCLLFRTPRGIQSANRPSNLWLNKTKMTNLFTKSVKKTNEDCKLACELAVSIGHQKNCHKFCLWYFLCVIFGTFLRQILSLYWLPACSFGASQKVYRVNLRRHRPFLSSCVFLSKPHPSSTTTLSLLKLQMLCFSGVGTGKGSR